MTAAAIARFRQYSWLHIV